MGEPMVSCLKRGKVAWQVPKQLVVFTHFAILTIGGYEYDFHIRFSDCLFYLL